MGNFDLILNKIETFLVDQNINRFVIEINLLNKDEIQYFKSNSDSLLKLKEVIKNILLNDSLYPSIELNTNLFTLLKIIEDISPEYSSNIISLFRIQLSELIKTHSNYIGGYINQLNELITFFRNSESNFISIFSQWLKILENLNQSFPTGDHIVVLDHITKNLKSFADLSEFMFLADAILVDYLQNLRKIYIPVVELKTFQALEPILLTIQLIEQKTKNDSYKKFNKNIEHNFKDIYEYLGEFFVRFVVLIILFLEKMDNMQNEMLANTIEKIISIIIKSPYFFKPFYNFFMDSLSSKNKFISHKQQLEVPIMLIIATSSFAISDNILKMSFDEDSKNEFYKESLELFLRSFYLFKTLRFGSNDFNMEKFFRKLISDRISTYYKSNFISKEKLIEIIDSSPYSKHNLLPFIFMDVKYCLYCNYEIDQDTVICPNCDKEIVNEEPPEFNLNSIINLAAIEDSYLHHKTSLHNLDLKKL